MIFMLHANVNTVGQQIISLFFSFRIIAIEIECAAMKRDEIDINSWWKFD